MLSLWYFSQGAQNISRLNFSQVQTEPDHGGGIRRQKPSGEPGRRDDCCLNGVYGVWSVC